jgi:hypothetical protein
MQRAESGARRAGATVRSASLSSMPTTAFRSATDWRRYESSIMLGEAVIHARGVTHHSIAIMLSQVFLRASPSLD